jgi:hypothetical protein
MNYNEFQFEYDLIIVIVFYCITFKMYQIQNSEVNNVSDIIVTMVTYAFILMNSVLRNHNIQTLK